MRLPIRTWTFWDVVCMGTSFCLRDQVGDWWARNRVVPLLVSFFKSTRRASSQGRADNLPGSVGSRCGEMICDDGKESGSRTAGCRWMALIVRRVGALIVP
jgi:hypothetical protein